MRVSLIVAAGGSGMRFKAGPRKSSAPSKLFFSLAGKPVLVHSLLAFRDFPQIREKILVIPPSGRSIIAGILREAGIKDFKLVAGGSTRAESVWNGLKRADRAHEWVMVHDAARPLVSRRSLASLLKEGARADGAILASPMVSTIKQAAPGKGLIERTLDRNTLFGAETPQLAKRELLVKCYKSLPGALQATDEASLLEAVKARVKLVLHDDWNPKITTYNDLMLAEAYLNGGNLMHRTGLGKDLHRLVAGRKLYLGGVEVPSETGSLGHSDGDVVLHAVIDAILGALGLGDIGEWFSDKSRKYKGVRSEKLIPPVLEEMKNRGWTLAHADVVITLEKPKLGAYKEKIRRNMARLLKVPAQNLSIKAKTNEGLGAEGEGKALSCDAIVTLSKGNHD